RSARSRNQAAQYGLLRPWPLDPNLHAMAHTEPGIMNVTMHRLSIVLPVLLLFAGSAFAQEQISGTVRDAGTGEFLPGVNIVIKGTATGTATDDDGTYEISVPSLSDTLVFSFIGYER